MAGNLFLLLRYPSTDRKRHGGAAGGTQARAQAGNVFVMPLKYVRTGRSPALSLFGCFREAPSAALTDHMVSAASCRRAPSLVSN